MNVDMLFFTKLVEMYVARETEEEIEKLSKQLHLAVDTARETAKSLVESGLL